MLAEKGVGLDLGCQGPLDLLRGVKRSNKVVEGLIALGDLEPSAFYLEPAEEVLSENAEIPVVAHTARLAAQ